MSEPVCRGLCLIGKCPNEHCVKYLKKNVGKIKADMQILTDLIIPPQACECQGKGIAVDIGTTTVVVYLIDLSDGRIIASKSELNAQAGYGVDVISRIKYASETDAQALQHAIVSQLNSMFQEWGDDISRAVITGNTTMLCLLTGTDVSPMGVKPFVTNRTFGEHIAARDIGIELTCDVFLPNCVSAFVGADIVTAALSCGMENDRASLLIDIGTNGEVMVGGKSGLVCASTAAGPAFEGAELSCGMAAVKGAINAVDVVKGEIIFSTIGDVPPVGLCGSGVLDAVALMAESGVIDETGRMDNISSRVFEFNGQPAFKITENVHITQQDVRKLQTAKAAIAAGIEALTAGAGLSIDKIEKLYLAGGFGNYMNALSALKIGLLPNSAKDKIIPVKNAAGAGAVMCLLNDGNKKECAHIAELSRHLELAEDALFMERYVENMFFTVL